MVTTEMQAHFENRTKRHIQLVRKYCRLIRDNIPGFPKIVGRGRVHDDSKYGELEMDPYIWLTWRYKCEDDGTECKMPPGMEAKIDKATEHHILTNRHHPEFHQKKTTGLLNKEDRDKPPKDMVDARGMEDLDIAEMVADWCGMSEERGNTPRDWAKKNVNVRWKFTPEQEALIFRILDAVWEKESVMKSAREIAKEILAKDATCGSPHSGSPKKKKAVIVKTAPKVAEEVLQKVALGMTYGAAKPSSAPMAGSSSFKSMGGSPRNPLMPQKIPSAQRPPSIKKSIGQQMPKATMPKIQLPNAGASVTVPKPASQPTQTASVK